MRAVKEVDYLALATLHCVSVGTVQEKLDFLFEIFYLNLI